MKIIFSQAFLSDVTRKDTTIIITKYFLGKTIIEKWFDNWDELTSDDFVNGFNSNQKTTERKVEGLWESDNKNLKIYIKIDEAEAYNINNSLMDYNIGFFYYKNAYGEEKISWILLPDDITLDQYTPGRFGFSEYTSLNLILGSNMINIPTNSIPSLRCRLECEGETEETIFLEGHGVFRGIDLWTSPTSTDSLIYTSSVKDFIIGDKGKTFLGSDVFLNPEGVVGENPSEIKIPESVEIEIGNPGSESSNIFSVSSLGGTLYLKGSWSWKKYKVISTGWELIGTGKDNTLDTLPIGKITYVENIGEGIIGEINWKNKSIEILPFAFNNGTRTATISLQVPKLFPDGSIITLKSTPEISIYQRTSTSAWEIDFPGISMFEEIPLLELSKNAEKIVTGRTNQDFVIVTEKGKEPEEGNWVRLDLETTDSEITEEDIKVQLEKVSHSNLWWELKLKFSTVTQREIHPLKYILWMGDKSYEFYVYCGGAFTYSIGGIGGLMKVEIPKPVISSQTIKTFSISSSELLEIKEKDLNPSITEFQVYLKSNRGENLEATILPPVSKVGDLVFASSLSHRTIIPASLPNINSGVWIPVKVIGSGEIPTEEIWRISIKPQGSEGGEKTLEIHLKEGKLSGENIPAPESKSNILHFHSIGNCLEGWQGKGLGTIISEVKDIKSPELTYLLMWTKEEGYTQLVDFACFDKGGGIMQLLTHLPMNTEKNLKTGTLILREWGKEDNLWTSRFVQGYITSEVDPGEIQLSGSKNSIFPVESYMKVKGIEQEPTTKGKKDAREIITFPEIIDVEWLENSEKLELDGRRIEKKGDEYFPVFNVSPKYYSEEFKIHIKLKLKITLDPAYRELYGIKNTSIFLPVDLWINKPKL